MVYVIAYFWENIKKYLNCIKLLLIIFWYFLLVLQVHAANVEEFLHGKGLLQNDLLQGEY